MSNDFSDVEGSIIAHQQVEIERLNEQLAWMMDLSQAESEVHEKAIDELQSNLFWSVVNKKFEANLELAREELAMEAEDTHGEMEYSERRAWNVAIEWTQDDIANTIGRELENRWWQRQDMINKIHFG